MTTVMTALPLTTGMVFTTATEWSNRGTLAALDVPGRLLAGFYHSAMTRTAGFNGLNIAQRHPGTLLGSDVLMVIGGGSAGTAGRIKVTTFAVLLFAILAEVRGDPDVEVSDRRIDHRVRRSAWRCCRWPPS